MKYPVLFMTSITAKQIVLPYHEMQKAGEMDCLLSCSPVSAVKWGGTLELLSYVSEMVVIENFGIVYYSA